MTLVADIREGKTLPEQVWSTKGMAGMAALELARSNRIDAIETLLVQMDHAPSATDRVAMAYAALRLLKENPTFSIPPNPDAHLAAVDVRRMKSLPGAP